MKTYTHYCILFLLFLSFSSQSQDWPIHNLRSDIIGAWTRAADFDSDGDPDILVQAGDSVIWYENLFPDWVPHLIFGELFDSQYALVGVSDIDGDGDPDVLTGVNTFPGQDSLFWHENQANGSQWETHFILKATYYFSTSDATAGDLDGDGDFDLVVTEYDAYPSTAGQIYWLEKVQGGTGWIKHLLGTGIHWHASLGDIDGDQDLDIVASNGNLYWLENQLPDTNWIPHVVLTASIYNNFYVGCQDIDQDGDLDIISSDNGSDWIVFYKNPDWEPVVISKDVTYPLIAMAVDLDGDGDLDVPYGTAGGGNPQSIGWAENLGSGNDWTTHDISAPTSDQAFPTGAGDFDGDGDMDLTALYFSYSSGTGDGFWLENPLLSSVDALRQEHGIYLSASPNPSSGLSAISFHLMDPGMIELALFSVQGEKLMVVDSGYKSPGEYTVLWNAKSRPAGIYLFRLTLNGHSQTLRLFLTND